MPGGSEAGTLRRPMAAHVTRRPCRPRVMDLLDLADALDPAERETGVTATQRTLNSPSGCCRRATPQRAVETGATAVGGFSGVQ